VTVGIGPKRVDDGSTRTTAWRSRFRFRCRYSTASRPVSSARRPKPYRRAPNTAWRNAAPKASCAACTGRPRQLRATAADYRSRAVAASPELLRIAEAAYQGGESSLLELLDAYRGTLETETTALELEKRAREARIEYELLTGSVTNEQAPHFSWRIPLRRPLADGLCDRTTNMPRTAAIPLRPKLRPNTATVPVAKNSPTSATAPSCSSSFRGWWSARNRPLPRT
jgi:hypothetical protein